MATRSLENRYIAGAIAARRLVFADHPERRRLRQPRQGEDVTRDA
jgi:hypothetical protein